MVVDATSLKRVERRVDADLHDFLTFPSFDADGLSCAGGTFRSNIGGFLTRHALLPPPSSLSPHLVTWQILFRVGDLADSASGDGSPLVVGLDVVEEVVTRSRSVYCDQCRVVGWSGHPVCTKRYHIIVKGDGTSIGGHPIKYCSNCGSDVHLSDHRCKSCSNVTTSENAEDWIYQQLEDTSHLLHGVVHENGYGHLLRINGREGGSKFLSGFHLMDFWDRLCKYLGVRKISVMDVSKKYGFEYRLLHAITKGHPWYGDWGYEFGAGSFALTQETYQEAVKTLSTLPLTTFFCQGRKPRTRIQDLILFYQSLSEYELVNVRDLFDFLMTSVHNAPTMSPGHEEPFKKRRLCASEALSNWTSCDVKRVEAAMIRVLKAVTGSYWVNWRTLRGAVWKAGPPDLIDDCLKGLVGKQASDNLFVHSRQNPQSGFLEYRLESGNTSLNGKLDSVNTSSSNSPSKDHMICDLRYLYESLLHPQTLLSFGPEAKREVAVRAAIQLLDCKQFVKDYEILTPLSIVDSPSLYLFCQVELFDQFEEDAINPPPELIVLPQNATISDLKKEASKVFQEIYIIFNGFHGEEILGYSGLDDSTHVKPLLKPLQTVTIRGGCNTQNGLSKYRMERGVERWVVDCSCGAQDDDGERMLACDVCGVWQHTRCTGIHDSDVVPARFVCGRCSRSAFKMVKLSGQCKDEAAVRVRGGGGKSLPRCFVSASFCTL